MREKSPMATCVVDFVGCTQPDPKEPVQVNRPNLRDPSKKQRTESRQNNPCSSLTKVQRENQVLKDELEVVPSTFGYFLLDVNSARGL